MVLISVTVACIKHSTEQPLMIMIMKMMVMVMVTVTDDDRSTVVVRDTCLCSIRTCVWC